MAEADSSLSFPDAPRGQLDKTLSELLAIASDVLETQGRLRALVRASQAVVQELDLTSVLRRIAESAVELLDAKYGALGVISPSGGLSEFIHVGIDEETAARIGHLPEGHGLLGAVIDDPHPILLPEVSDDPRSAGFPPEHPPMSSFLGVPIRVRDEVFGNLYLTESKRGGFTEEDEQLATSLAATAGFAIDNARLFAEVKRREAWTAASAEVTAAMLGAGPGDRPLELLADRLLALTSSDLVLLTSHTGDGTTMRIDIAAGADADALEGHEFDGNETFVWAALEARQPGLISDAIGAQAVTGRALGAVLAVPLVVHGDAESVLLLGRVDAGAPFTTEQLSLAAEFAGQASVALALARARRAEHQLELVEDRGRIARDLHDHVIQQLFGTGLDIQRVASSLADQRAAQELMEAVDGLDSAIAQIRTVVFALTSRTQTRDSVRHRLINVANEIGASMRFPPSLSFSGPVDLVVHGTIADDVEAVAREALANVVRHSGASHSSARLSVDESHIELTIEDDGTGIDSDRRSGLANLADRAKRRGGELLIDTARKGTRLVWRVPISEGTGE